MHFAIQKEALVRSLKDVSNALATRVVQPILSNILIQSENETTIKFQATDLDLSIESKANAVVYKNGSITIPGKKLLEIVSKLPNELVSFQVNAETYDVSVQCHRSKFNIAGLPAEDFPKQIDGRTSEGILMPADILRKSILQTTFAAANYDTSSILGGVYMVIEGGVFECTATDGSRLAHRFENLNVASRPKKQIDNEQELEGKTITATLEKPVSIKAIIPAKACTELVKLIDASETIAKLSAKQIKDTATYINNEVRVSIVGSQITFATENHYLSTRLISGEYPRYRELFPTEYNHLANFKREEFVSAIDRVAVMSDDRTHLVKMHFEDQTLQITANTPDVGKAQEEVPMHFEGQVLDLAVNVRYIVDVLQKLSAEDVQLEMTGPLKPIIIKAVDDDNYKYLLMPVQSKS